MKISEYHKKSKKMKKSFFVPMGMVMLNLKFQRGLKNKKKKNRKKLTISEYHKKSKKMKKSFFVPMGMVMLNPKFHEV